MKKFVIVAVIAAMVVADLVLSGMNVVLGVILILAALGSCAVIDYCNSRESHTTSITRAARQSRRSTSIRESSYARQSWDGWQRCSPELQCAK